MGPRKVLEILKHYRRDLIFPQFMLHRNDCFQRYTSFKTQFEKFYHTYSRSKPRRVKKFLGSAQELHTFKNAGLFPDAINEGVRCYCSKSDKFLSSFSRHHYHEEIEAAVNNQILAEFNAGFAYLSMASYFARSDVALFGANQFFMRMFRDEIEHALAFINHQNLRGGQVKLCAITTVECSDWCSLHKALEVSLEMEKLILDKLIDLAKIAEKHNDNNTHEVVSSFFIKEGLSSITQLAGLLTRANKIGVSGMSEYFFDKELSTAAAHGTTPASGCT